MAYNGTVEVKDFEAVTCGGAAFNGKTYELAAQPLGLLLLKSLAANKSAWFVETDKHTETGFERSDVVSKLVAIERKPCLKTEGVAAS